MGLRTNIHLQDFLIAILDSIPGMGNTNVHIDYIPSGARFQLSFKAEFLSNRWHSRDIYDIEELQSLEGISVIGQQIVREFKDYSHNLWC